jgi:hypothetical protein
VHVVEEKAPLPSLLKVTVPVGVVGLPFVSVTVAVHVLPALMGTELATQLTDVVVPWVAAFTVRE